MPGRKDQPTPQERSHPEKVEPIRIDPELKRQLESSSGPVEAVFTLRLPLGAAPADEVERSTRELLRRVQDRTHARTNAVNIFKNLGSFAISADAEVVRGLMQESEIASAAANRHPSALQIPPTDVRSEPSQEPKAGCEPERRKPRGKPRRGKRGAQ